MTIRSIMLFAPAETTNTSKGPTAYAISMAKAYDAHLTVMCVALDVTTPGNALDAKQKAKDIAAVAEASGVDCLVITEHSHAIGVTQVVEEHARVHDLIICGTNQSGLLSERDVAEGLLFKCGRPVVVVPPSHSEAFAPGAVAVAWDNSAKSARALGDAVSVLGADNVQFLSIDGEKSWQTDMEPSVLVDAMARRGVTAQFHFAELNERKISMALAEEAIRRKATMLVMGGFAHSRLRQIVLGGATAQVLDAPSMPTLLSH